MEVEGWKQQNLLDLPMLRPQKKNNTLSVKVAMKPEASGMDQPGSIFSLLFTLL